jgi:hypothetical protein
MNEYKFASIFWYFPFTMQPLPPRVLPQVNLLTYLQYSYIVHLTSGTRVKESGPLQPLQPAFGDHTLRGWETEKSSQTIRERVDQVGVFAEKTDRE